MRSFRPVTLSLCCALSVLLLGCAPGVGADTPPSPETIVSQRATERWEALIKGDVGTAYGYLSPSYRAVVPPELYRARFGGAVRWKSVEGVTAVCEEERCDVRVLLHYEVPRFKTANTKPLDEVWVSTSGQWWLYQRP